MHLQKTVVCESFKAACAALSLRSALTRPLFSVTVLRRACTSMCACSHATADLSAAVCIDVAFLAMPGVLACPTCIHHTCCRSARHAGRSRRIETSTSRTETTSSARLRHEPQKFIFLPSFIDWVCTAWNKLVASSAVASFAGLVFRCRFRLRGYAYQKRRKCRQLACSGI